MTKINNLFFFYTLSCIGFGVGNVYWNERYTYYIFIGVSMLIGLFIFFSKYFYTKESYEFFRKQVFFTSLIFLLSVFVRSDRNIYKVINLAIKGNDLSRTGQGTTLA